MKDWEELTETEQRHWLIRCSLIFGVVLGMCLGADIVLLFVKFIELWHGG